MEECVVIFSNNYISVVIGYRQKNAAKTHIPSPTPGTFPDHYDLSNNQE